MKQLGNLAIDTFIKLNSFSVKCFRKYFFKIKKSGQAMAALGVVYYDGTTLGKQLCGDCSIFP